MNKENPAPHVLILGIGNYLMGDEGVGVHLIHELEKETLPAGFSEGNEHARNWPEGFNRKPEPHG